MATARELLEAARANQRAGRMREAERLAARALQLAPHDVDALSLLGVIAGTLGAPEVAAGHFERAVSLRPDDPRIRRNWATALRDSGKTEEAIAEYELALQGEPRSAVGHVGLAEALMEQARFAQAVKHNQIALDLQPTLAVARWNLAELAVQGHYEFSASEFATWETLAGRDDLPAADASLLNFAWAILLDRQEEFARAFAHFRQ